MHQPIRACFGHHKCATEWITSILTQICGALGWKIYLTQFPLRLPLGFEQQERYAEQIKAARLHCASGDYDFLIALNSDVELVRTVTERGFRGFHVIRDPRDIVTSGYFSHLATHHVHPDRNPWLIEHRRRLQSLNQEEGFLLELDYAATYMERLAAWDYGNPNIFETRFEILTVNPNVEVKKLLSFCEVHCPDDLFTAVMEANSFAALSGGRTPGSTDTSSHWRKGTPGDYKNYFTPAVEQKFNRLYPGLVEFLGYE